MFEREPRRRIFRRWTYQNFRIGRQRRKPLERPFPPGWKLPLRTPAFKARQVRLDYAAVICRLRCAMNWSRISRRLRRLFLTVVFCPTYSGQCTQALTFPRWGKRRKQWRGVMSCGELLALFSVTDTAESWQTTSRPGASTA